MARNMKPEYIKKLINTKAPNGYKFDLANYMSNPSYDYEYPVFTKTLHEDEETLIIRDLHYFKHWDGTGEYTAETKTFNKKDACGTWNIAKSVTTEILSESNRFSLKTLLSYC